MDARQRSHQLAFEDPSKQEDRDDAAIGWPGKRSLTQQLSSSPGSELPSGLQRQLEGSMGGENLGGVRVHIDSNAAAAAQGLNARAFTVGQSVYFGAGQYDPHSKGGQRLIAHEVAHTVQQRGAVGSPQLDSLDVSAPGDAHETEAESFAHSFVAGGRGAKITPVSRGVIARAVIQRDLLDGGPPPGLDSSPAPVDAKEASPAELTSKAQESIRKARGSGGTQAVVGMVKNMRAHSTAKTQGPVENAISSELNQEEKDALAGKKPDASKTANANSGQDAKHGAEAPAHSSSTSPTSKAAAATNESSTAKNGGGEHADAKQQGGETANAKGGAGGETANAKAGGGAEHAKGAHDANAKGGEHGAADSKAGGEHAPAPGGHEAAGHEAGGHEAAGHEAGGHEAAPHVSEAGGRELIEQELAFHDRWKVYQGGAGGRAAHLVQTLFYADGPGSAASKIFHSDLAQGVIGGALWEGGALVTKLVATKVPLLNRVPGIGNIIGGGMSAYILFSNGGAGAKEMVGEMAHGIGSAFSAKNWHDSPFLTAANLIEGIVATLELVGHVCNILAGLAYAFSAIAAVGGLLSIFFPPLAFLVPYIPVAINFGRACGGIATAAFAVTYLVSPIPAILRTIHQIFSNDDPAKLAAEEDGYHDAAINAIACYAAGALGDQADKRGVPGIQEPNPEAPHKVLGSNFIGGNVSDIQSGIGTYRSAMDGHLTPGLHGQNFKASTDNVAHALGAENGPYQMSKDYFNPSARTEVAHHEKHVEDKKLDKAEGKLDSAKKDRAYVEHRADVAQQKLDANPTQQNFDRSVQASQTAERHDTRVANAQQNVNTQQHNVERAEWRTQIPSGMQGEEFGGEMSDGIEALVEQQIYVNPEERRDESANEAYEALRGEHGGGEHGGGEHGGGGGGETHAAHDAKGHIILPEPPGSLEEINEIDQAIQKLEGQKQKYQSTTADAQATQKDAAARSAGLKHVSADVTHFVAGKQAHSQAEQSRINAQTADLQSKSTQAHGKAGQGTQQASGPMRGIASAAHTVDGVLQRVPSNKFFDVSGAKRNVHQFVVGMDTIMGADSKNQAQQGKTSAALAQRNQKTSQAAAKNQQATAEGQKLVGRVNEDAGLANTAATQAGEIASQAKTGAQTTAAKIQQLTAERQQKWQALLAWAAQHRALREQATAHE